MLDRDILFINRPSAAYISLGKLVLRMRTKNSRARSETNSKRAGSRHCGSKLSQPTVQRQQLMGEGKKFVSMLTLDIYLVGKNLNIVDGG